MRYWIGGIATVALIASACQAQRAERLGQECRQEVVKLCGTDRGKMRECLREKRAELSENCQNALVERAKQKTGDRGRKNGRDMGMAQPAAEQSYGNDPLQKLDFYKAQAETGSAPLLIFVHGGGWKRGDKQSAMGSDKVKHYTSLGYHIASINYRLVPAATVEQQAADVASAVAHLLKNAGTLGVDKSRVVLMGHSAGAHLAALVGTDPQYLRREGLSLNALSGVIPIDGAGYDVPAQMVDGERIMKDIYAEAFGNDPARQKALSPLWHAEGPNVASFLILHVEREASKGQSEALASALQKNGAKAQLNAFVGKGLMGHMEINRRLGDPAYPATPVVDAWLKGVFGK
jgi:arylformamidase